jgi:hypothetical protein
MKNKPSFGMMARAIDLKVPDERQNARDSIDRAHAPDP